MAQFTSDEATNNVDAENPPRRNNTSNQPDAEVTAGERARVEQWLKDIKVSRTFDEEIRKLYAQDRRYARADTSAMVQHSIIQAYIDILVAFLVARDPDFDCPPSERVGSAELENAELYGKTMSIVISHLLRSARLKRVAAKIVRSALSVGVGWLKGVWHEDIETDPLISQAVKDAQQNIAQLESMNRDILDGEGNGYEDRDLEIQKYKDIEAGLMSKLEMVVARGMSLAMINPEDMVISVEAPNIVDVEEFGWCGHRYFVSCEKGEALFPRVPKHMLMSATKYSPRKPAGKKDRDSPGATINFNSEDADSYVTGSNSGNSPQFLCAYEIWDGEANQYFTVIEGINDRYAREPVAPQAPTTRFYPFFCVSFTEIDGERHPQSLVQRSYKMQDEIDRTLNKFVEHRKRTIPGMLFDAAQVDSNTVKRVANNATQEYVGVKMKGDPSKRDIRRAFMPKTYAQIDMALYDISPYVRCMETIWGIQEALAGTVQVAKTATEAEIQQAGTQAKSGYKRDILENMFNQLGNYCAELSAWNLEREDVQQIAGSEAFWMEIDSVDEMQAMLSIEVRAGSSGKPDTVAKREAWMAMFGQIKELIMAIADERQSSPDQISECLEALLVEMGDRLGERIDIKQFIPQAPPAPVMNPMNPTVPLTNTQLQQLQVAQANAMAAMQAPPPGAGGGGEGGGAPPPDEGQGAGETAAQDTMAPQAAPPM